MEARFSFKAGSEILASLTVTFGHGLATSSMAGVSCAFARILEVQVPFRILKISPGDDLGFQLSLWQGGLPIDAIPQQGWMRLPTTDPAEWGG